MFAFPSQSEKATIYPSCEVRSPLDTKLPSENTASLMDFESRATRRRILSRIFFARSICMLRNFTWAVFEYINCDAEEKAILRPGLPTAAIKAPLRR